MKRYFLGRDNSAHWYIVEAKYRTDWEHWCTLPEDDEESWEVPDFAMRLNGGPEQITFTNPEEPEGLKAVLRAHRKVTP